MTHPTSDLHLFEACLKAFNDRKDAEVIQIAPPLTHSSDQKIREKSAEMLATSLFSLADYAQSSTIWLALAEQTQNADHWLSAVTSSTMARRYDEAQSAYEIGIKKFNERAEKLMQDGTPPMPGMNTAPLLMFYYAHALCDSGAPERALLLIDQFFQIFKSLVIPDTHYLLSGGMVPFSNFLGLVHKTIPLTPTQRDSATWHRLLSDLSLSLDSDGKTLLEMSLKDWGLERSNTER